MKHRPGRYHSFFIADQTSSYEEVSVHRTRRRWRLGGDSEGMDKDDRIRARYQHCALNRVGKLYMTNQSLRARFGLESAKPATVSQIIAATIDAGLVRLDDSVGESRRYARYLPFWA